MAKFLSYQSKKSKPQILFFKLHYFTDTFPGQQGLFPRYVGLRDYEILCTINKHTFVGVDLDC